MVGHAQDLQITSGAGELLALGIAADPGDLRGSRLIFAVYSECKFIADRQFQAVGKLAGDVHAVI